MKQMDNRCYDAGKGMNDSPDSVRRAGGEDPRRYDARIVMETKIRDHEMSGYNHRDNPAMSNSRPDYDNDYMRKQEAKVDGMGTIEPNGLFRY